jgi:hypothetical protein
LPHFALIDAAREEMIYPLIQQEAVFQSLFGGKLAPELVPVAPYIVRLDPGTRFTQAFQQRGWVNKWGITCHAAAKLPDVRRQLRRNIEAILPDGTVTLFRFYDPRVFVPFITGSSAEELGPWFGPIDAYWAPHPTSGATMQYMLQDGALTAHQIC